MKHNSMRLFGQLKQWFPKDGSQSSSISILLETNILGSHPDRANQNLWEQCQLSVSTPGGSEAC